MAVKDANANWLLNFRVCMFLKITVKNWFSGEATENQLASVSNLIFHQRQRGSILVEWVFAPFLQTIQVHVN